MDVALSPRREAWNIGCAEIDVGEPLVLRPGKAPCDAADLLLDQRCRAVFQMRPFRFHRLAEPVDTALLEYDLDARLVDVVAPAVAIVDAQDSVEIGEQMLPGEKFADHVADERRAAQPAAGDDAEAFRLAPPHRRQAY